MKADVAYEERDGSEFTYYDGFSVEYRDASHRYWLHEGVERRDAVSITNALKVLGKQLVPWAQRTGAHGAVILERQGELDGITDPYEIVERLELFKLDVDSKRDEGAERGTLVHKVLSTWASEGIVPDVGDFPLPWRGYVQGLCRWLLEAAPVPLAVETVVASRLYGFAGRFDLFAEIGELAIPTLCDLKTNPNGRIYAEHHAQAAGYEAAMLECGMEPQGVILVAVGEDGSYEQVACEASPEDFISILDTHRRMARLSSALTARRA
jgi:hypothetical protein